MRSLYATSPNSEIVYGKSPGQQRREPLIRALTLKGQEIGGDDANRLWAP